MLRYRSAWSATPGDGELVAHPKRVVSRIYADLGYEMAAGYEARLDEAEAKAGRHQTQHGYSLEEFALDEAEIRGALAPLFERFGWPSGEAPGSAPRATGSPGTLRSAPCDPRHLGEGKHADRGDRCVRRLLPAQGPDAAVVHRRVEPVRAGERRIAMRHHDPDRAVRPVGRRSVLHVDLPIAVVEGAAPVVAEREAPVAAGRWCHVDHDRLVRRALPPAALVDLAGDAEGLGGLRGIARLDRVRLRHPGVDRIEEDLRAAAHEAQRASEGVHDVVRREGGGRVAAETLDAQDRALLLELAREGLAHHQRRRVVGERDPVPRVAALAQDDLEAAVGAGL